MATDAFDWVKLGLDLYNYNEQDKTLETQSEQLQEGFQQQNPWAAYQPMFAGGLMSMLSNPGQITQTPGYQFAYDQGLQGLFAKHASTGNRFSGRALTEAMQFGQGLASQMYNSEIDRMGRFAGAGAPITGGVTTGQNQAQLTSQGAFDQAYFWNNLFNDFSGGNNSAAPSVTNQGGDSGSFTENELNDYGYY